MSAALLLAVNGLNLRLGRGAAAVHVLRDINLQLHAGESLGIVGESGSGKTQLLLSLPGLSPADAVVTGSIRYRDQELRAGSAALARLRGREIGMVFQDPTAALNPFLTIGVQLTEGLRAHRSASAAAARTRACELMALVHIAEPQRRLDHYPHQLSGGMQQRVMIAMAMMCEPRLLLCDEPTTALDMTLQSELLQLLQQLRASTGVALIVVSHDLSVVAQLTDRVAVMYAGRIVEQAPTSQLLRAPQHPYTAALQRSVLSLDAELNAPLATISGNPPLLTALPEGCSFAPRCRHVHARCHRESPALRVTGADRLRACHYDGPLA
jgi:oligopeptide transport system ATP-binding protein